MSISARPTYVAAMSPGNNRSDTTNLDAGDDVIDPSIEEREKEILAKSADAVKSAINEWKTGLHEWMKAEDN
jgi:hypothetical protein